MTAITWDLDRLGEGPRWRGAVDGMNAEWIFGWVLEAGALQTPVEVEIRLFDIPVLSAVCTIARPDIGRIVAAPVQCGFSAPLHDIGPEPARAVLARLREAPADLAIRDILSITVAGEAASLPISDGVGHIGRGVLQRALAAAASRFPGGISGRRAAREALLATAMATPEPPVRVLAHYLPQFCPDPGAAPGQNVSDWQAVAAARPLYPGHAQPQQPGALGFYDLRLDRAQRDQVALAKDHGISGFCYHYDWFAGESRMTLPIERHVALDLDLDFCLCWANAPWTSEGRAAPARRHDDDIAFIRSCLPWFHHHRHIRIHGAPLLLVRHIETLKHPAATIRRWRKILRAEGFADLHVSLVEGPGASDPAAFGCDSSTRLPPASHDPALPDPALPGLDPGFTGRVGDYAALVRRELASPAPMHLRFRGAMPGWDDSPRLGRAATLFPDASPALFATWMQHLVLDARKRLPEGARFVFVNAWNDWASGAQLEPDAHRGTARLAAIRQALAPATLALAPLMPPPPGQPDPLAATRRLVESLIASNRVLTGLLQGASLATTEVTGFLRPPPGLMEIHPAPARHLCLERLNGHPPPAGDDVLVPAWQGLLLEGWFLLDERATGTSLLALRRDDDPEARWLAPLHHRHGREDVVDALGLGPKVHGCGFQLRASLEGVPPGRYWLEFIIPGALGPRRARALATDVALVIG